jgi:guanine nucleotide-binding protein G(i) subunit alpha
MGCCASADATAGDPNDAARSREIDRALGVGKQKNDLVAKLLLLGAGESGKSTIFKQVNHLYGNGYSEDMRQRFTPIVHSNCILSMRTLIREAERRADTVGILSPKIVSSKHAVMSSKNVHLMMSRELADHIAKLWVEPAIQATFARRSEFQLTDSARYFFDKIDEVGSADYLPTYHDVLHVRARTSGIVETQFSFAGQLFQVMDVGGQRNERKKWIHCFDSVTAVIFVAAINEFDQVLYEDNKTNRLEEAVNLFDAMFNNAAFTRTSFILFLNKRDLLREKLETGAKVAPHLPYYDGPEGDYDTVVAFIKGLFMQCNESRNRQIYTHVTCATDTKNVQFTFTAIKDIIVRTRLAQSGLI